MMVGGLDLRAKHVLEPSAGAGNIIDHVTAMGAIVTSCEKVEELARVCATKSKFMKHDFMEVTREEVSHVDYIIMNPPFSADVRHIMHAWEIAPDGCEVIALCNWQTIDNRYTVSRTRLGDVIRRYGHATNIGDVFRQAERTTDVEIGLVHLFKPASENSFEGFFDDQEDEQEEQYNGIMPYNAIREAVQRYVEACKLFDQVADNAVLMNSLVGVFGVDKLTFSITQEQKERSVEDFKIELQKRAWQWVFSKMNMEKFMTSKLREEINAFVEKQKNVPFTMRNIYRMFEMVIGTHADRMNRVFVEVFDRLTMHYHENRYHVEGWKTNSHYMVNQKFILDGLKDWMRSYSDKVGVPYNGRSTELMTDFVKALNYLTGQQLEPNLYAAASKNEWEYGKWYDWTYFEVKFFKKGTMHAKFKDSKHWELFNRSVAKAKGYTLPEKL